MYTSRNFKTKKALKEAVGAGERITVYEPGPFKNEQRDGRCLVEGPHFPQPHKWYASVELKDGIVVKVS
jgi:hypothetical protein